LQKAEVAKLLHREKSFLEEQKKKTLEQQKEKEEKIQTQNKKLDDTTMRRAKL